MNTKMTLWKKLAVIAATLSAFSAVPSLSQVAQAAPAKAAEQAPPTGDEASGVVNINTASEEELEMLPGVGPSKSAAIVAWRKKYGAFKKVDDLTKVKGFGHKTMKKLKPYLSVAGATTYKGKKSKSEAEDGPQP